MKSMYGRQFTLVAGIVLVSFVIFGSAFAWLSFRYTIEEKRQALERNAGFIADFTVAVWMQGRDETDEFFQIYVTSISNITDAAILLVRNDDGQITYSSSSSLTGCQVSQQILEQVEQTGQYTAISNLGGVFKNLHFVAGLPITIPSIWGGEVTVGTVFVAAKTSSTMEMWRSLVVIFILTALVVLFLAFILSSLTCMRLTKPLKAMAEATRKFAHGEFDARVDTYGRRDEIGALAESFNAMAESLAKSEGRRSEFVANVSHELKTPMTTIAGFADGILDGTIPPERQEEALRTISAETRRLSRLVRRMLDLSRLQSAEKVIAQEPFDIGETMARVLVSLETKINAKSLDVDASFPEEPLLVWGDADAITQVCYNLLDNAIKFAKEGGHLWIGVAAKGIKAHISIADEGLTIPPEELPLIFDRFHKTDHSRSVDREGVGLGLYIVKTILNNHKENITVTSQDGRTEFVFTLAKA